MTTQKVTSVLNAAGFKAFRTYAEKVNGVYTNIKTGDYYSFKSGNVIGIETCGKRTEEVCAALVAQGLNAVILPSKMIKIA